MPKCIVNGCSNRVSTARFRAGHPGCIERHPTAAPARNLIPLPKGATVLAGADDNLKGIANSHKTGVVDHTAETFQQYAGVRPIVLERKPLVPVAEQLLRKLRETPESGGGVYITGEPAIQLGYRLGLLSSRSAPSRLTARGQLAREIAQQGRIPVELL